ncbi:MAG TPA: DegT/DnrJ/EryC1/StrS family aminotransferase, partial [Terriglobales bacterium]|nr:DegT/DnrJ/EryC1/StrS family aminotransferase [Terriglobales bacterium]
WYYAMVELGYNYRMNDIQSALGLSQLEKLPEWIVRRRVIARRYDQAIACLPGFRALQVQTGVDHAYHLYVIEVDCTRLDTDRAGVFAALRAENIGVNVHYLPVYLHPYYRENFATCPGMCPVAEAAYERILSLPMFPAMSDDDVEDVIEALEKVTSAYAVESRTAAVAGSR